MYSDLTRIRAALAKADLDAVVAFSQHNMYYLSGHRPAFLERVGETMVMVPTDPSADGLFVCSEFELSRVRKNTWIRDLRPVPSWLEIDDLEAVLAGGTRARSKPEQFDEEYPFRALADAFRERGLTRARIGCELAVLPATKEAALRRLLPEAALVEVGPLLLDVRAVKTPAEIELLRTAARLGDAGIRALVELGSGLRGRTAAEVRLLYQRAVLDAALRDPAGQGVESARLLVTVGGDVAPTRGEHPDRCGHDALFWWDYGVVVNGYASDAGRSCLVGEPHTVCDRIAGALEAGMAAALERLRPGVLMSEVFAAAQDAVRRAGLPTYTRGHVGHAIGIGEGEWPPFLSATSQRVLEPDMVLAVEVPYYVRGLGGFQIEEDVRITATGCEVLTRLPRPLIQVG